jgi:hypothetical protein
VVGGRAILDIDAGNLIVTYASVVKVVEQLMVVVGN